MLESLRVDVGRGQRPRPPVHGRCGRGAQPELVGVLRAETRDACLHPPPRKLLAIGERFGARGGKLPIGNAIRNRAQLHLKAQPVPRVPAQRGGSRRHVERFGSVLLTNIRICAACSGRGTLAHVPAKRLRRYKGL